MSDEVVLQPKADFVQLSGFDNALRNMEKGLVLADTIAKSGLVPKGYDKFKTFAILLRGMELNIPPMQALTSLYVVNGKVAMEAQMMLALIYRSSQFEKVEFKEEPGSFTTILKRKNHEPVSYTFSRADAEKMKYSTEGGAMKPLLEKFNWATMERTMLKWRSISGCARMTFPDVIGGLHTPDELGAIEIAQEDGSVVVEVPFDESAEYERILNKLRYFEKKGDKEEFDAFIEQNKVEVEKMSESKAGILKRMASSIYNRFNPKPQSTTTQPQHTEEASNVQNPT